MFERIRKIFKKGPRGPERTLTTEQKAERRDRALNTCYVCSDRSSQIYQHHIKDRENFNETVDPKYYDGKYNTRGVCKKDHKEYHSWKKKHPPESNRWRDHKKNLDIFARMKRKKVPKSKRIKVAKEIKNKGRTSRYTSRPSSFRKRFRKKIPTRWKKPKNAWSRKRSRPRYIFDEIL